MAKKNSVNKTQAVRDFIGANSNATPKEVSDGLAKKGIEVSPNYVSSIKGKMTANKGKRKRRQKAATAMSAKTGVGIAEIKAAFVLLKHCGGIAAARQAIAAAAEIQKVL
ncbi:MAG: hypothetical protein IT426_21425 [Pirellulales bacterium]|nr:hypothetical protein [Pirellulales bacterium]